MLLSLIDYLLTMGHPSHWVNNRLMSFGYLWELTNMFFYTNMILKKAHGDKSKCWVETIIINIRILGHSRIYVSEETEVMQRD